MISSLTRLARVSPCFLVTTSHFSGVVTSIWVWLISALVSDMSPVSSRTSSPSGSRRRPNPAAISAARAFIGATYTILNWSFLITPASKCCLMVCVMQSIATLVLPAPVGAHTSMFSLVL